VDGKAITGLTEKFAIIIPSTELFDVQLLDKTRIYLGNTGGVTRTEETRLVDINNDGRLDLALFYNNEVAFGTTAASQNINEADARKNERTDGPLGIHFVTPSGENFLVSNIYALGAPVPMPAVTLDIPPSLFGAPDETPAPELKQTAFSSVHPNPFNPQTTMSYTLASQTRVRVAIYDVRGALVRLLVDDSQSAGSHQAVWNGVDDSGRPMGSGIYFVRMIAGSYQETRKVVMLK
jgi:hypothetical protein